MSQRGGSVVTYVRWGEKVYSPIIDRGQADVILSFEPLFDGGLPLLLSEAEPPGQPPHEDDVHRLAAPGLPGQREGVC